MDCRYRFDRSNGHSTSAPDCGENDARWPLTAIRNPLWPHVVFIDEDRTGPTDHSDRYTAAIDLIFVFRFFARGRFAVTVRVRHRGRNKSFFYEKHRTSVILAETSCSWERTWAVRQLRTSNVPDAKSQISCPRPVFVFAGLRPRGFPVSSSLRTITNSGRQE